MREVGVRSDLSVAVSVWHALFLREAGMRLATGRAAWLWLLLEPAAHMVFLMVLFGLVRHQVMRGANIELFILTGVWGFFLFRNVATRCMDAISANQALFAYRQVRPVDTVLVRGAVELVLYVVVGAVLLAGLALCDIDIRPDDPLRVALAAALLWAFALGLGLCFSALSHLLPELGKLIRLAFTPLYFLSSVMYPIASVPAGARHWLLRNPVVHGLESLRAGYFAGYRGAAYAEPGYLAACALAALFLGLALHARHADALAAQ